MAFRGHHWINPPIISQAAPSGSGAIVGTLTATLDAATLVSTGVLAISGAVGVTLGDATLSATGTLPIVGTASVTLADATPTSTGTLAIDGTLAATLADATVSSTPPAATPDRVLPGLDRGPPFAGSPWIRIERPSINSSITIISIPPAAVATRAYINFGPPIPGSPWAITGGKGTSNPPTPSPPPPPGPPPSPPPPPPTNVGNDKNFITYLPGDTEARLRRFSEITTDVLNSLMRKGQLVKVGLNSWTLSTDNIPLILDGLTGEFSSGPFGDEV